MQEPDLGASQTSRFWLFAPFVLLGLAAIAWGAGWFVIRGRATVALDDWFERERQAGRQWSCPDRAAAGFPFRIEIVCPSLTLRQPDLTASLGRVATVAQVYQPRHVIAEVEGPLRIEAGRLALEGTWRLLQISLRNERESLQRVSVAIDEPNLRVMGVVPDGVALAASHLEAHLRPTAVSSYEISARAQGARLPLLDELVGGTEAADLEIGAMVSQAQAFAPSLTEWIERWRAAGGALEIGQLSMVKGSRRFEAKGTLRIDDQHRPAGQLQGAAAGLEGLVGQVLDGPAAIGALLGALTGRPAPEVRPQRDGAGLRPLPPLRLENGRVFIGPVAVPRLRLEPLY